MTVTKEQARAGRSFHYTGQHQCTLTFGARGGVSLDVTEARANGKLQEWKRTPDRFVLPVKRGLYEHSYITESNADKWHIPEECPAFKQLNEYQAAKRAEAEANDPGIVKGQDDGNPV